MSIIIQTNKPKKEMKRQCTHLYVYNYHYLFVKWEYWYYSYNFLILLIQWEILGPKLLLQFLATVKLFYVLSIIVLCFTATFTTIILTYLNISLDLNSYSRIYSSYSLFLAHRFWFASHLTGKHLREILRERITSSCFLSCLMLIFFPVILFNCFWIILGFCVLSFVWGPSCVGSFLNK